MTIFCTNCGHSNEQGNKVCIECGQALIVANTKREAGNAKKPMAQKTKVLVAVGVLILVSLAGLYSWGTKSASAETAVSKFFEALESKDAKGLAEQMALSNGEQVTAKQAKAFMEMYPDLEPLDLEQVATIGESGKVLGVFNAHKIIFSEQTASFEFPHEGLELQLNGEKITSVTEEDGIYMFSGIVPGSYAAEFVYKGEYTEFKHPFELEVDLYAGSEETTIFEELPAESVVLNFDVFNETNFKDYKVMVGDKEFPVDATGKTEQIGPLPLDGSVTAKGEVEFPWGKQVSEPLKIDSDIQTLEIALLSKEQEGKLVEQLTQFAEQYTQALGIRDAAVLKTVTADQQKVIEEEVQLMKDNSTYFKGSLKEINVDESSISLTESGEAVTLVAELVYTGANYAKGDEAVLDTISQQADMSFVYDKENGNWLVDEYNKDGWLSSIEQTRSIKGSGKVYEVAGSAGTTSKPEVSVSEEPAEEKEENLAVSNNEVAAFFTNYNDNSVAAINSGDFRKVSSMITLEGPRFQEQSDFIDSLYSKGITEEHLGTTVEKIEVMDDNFIQVTTIEKFVIHGTEKSSEKKYRTVTLVEVFEQNFYVHKLMSTKEI